MSETLIRTLMSSLEKKINFVKEISEALIKVKTNIIKVEYVVFKHVTQNWIEEYLIVEYDGGAISARRCSGNSCSAIFQEISKLLDHGYYSEVEDYLILRDSKNYERIFQIMDSKVEKQLERFKQFGCYEDFMDWMNHECPGESVDLEHIEEYIDLEFNTRPALVRRFGEIHV